MSLYRNSNSEVLCDMIELHKIKLPIWVLQIDRKLRIVRNDRDAQTWDVPDDYDLS